MSHRTRTRSSGATNTASRERPTQWAFRAGDCAHPTRVTTRWHLPGASSPRDTAPDWHLVVTHDQDTDRTTADQWITDDPAGHLSVQIDGTLVELSAGNTAAVIRSDPLLPQWERVSLAGGVGFFAEVARCSAWLGAVKEDERRRRLALCVSPTVYPVVLSTPASRYLAARHVHDQISGEWGIPEPSLAIGYLSAITDQAPPEIQDRLHRIAALAVCDRKTRRADRVRICDLLIARQKQARTRTQALHGCCLRILTDDRVREAVQKYAESLLKGTL